MKATNFFKLTLAAALVIGIGFMVSPDTKAADGTIGSTVTVGTALTVTGNNDLIWGVFAAPTSGTDTWVMSPAGVLTGGTPANDLFVDHTPGDFTINGQALAGVTYSVAITTNFADAAITLSALTVSPASPSPLSAGGMVEVDVGGTLAIGTAAVSGSHTGAVITLTADYQ